MNIWITGESSFIARSFSKYLGDKYNVINNLENQNYSYWRSYLGKNSSQKEIDIFDPTLKTLISNANIDLIIHNASFTGVNECKEFPTSAIKTNIEGTYIVAKIAKELDIPIIYISTPEVYFIKNTIYQYTKKCAEEILGVVGANYIIVVPGELYGLQNFSDGLTQLIMTTTNKMENAVLNIDPESKKPFTYIEDFLTGLDLLINNFENIRGQVNKVNINTSSKYSICDLLEYFDEKDYQYYFNIFPENDILLEYELDNSFLKNLGWQPKVDLIENIEEIREEI